LERRLDEQEQLDRPQGPKEGTVTEYKIQSMDDLEDEMRAVARGEKPAPADTARASFQSVDATIWPPPLPQHRRPGTAVGTLDHWRQIFHPVGWFIPPYVTMGAISQATQIIMERGDNFTQDDLEKILELFYGEEFLARMVASFYPIAPAIKDYQATIRECVEAHFFGLNRIAALGLIPVVEGAGWQLAVQRGLKQKPGKNALVALANDCKKESVEKSLGAVGEVVSMMESFASFISNYLYVGASNYPLTDKTNRHGMTHGVYADADYGTPLNFYKMITAINFLTFISSFRANMSWLGPSPSQESTQLTLYYQALKNSRAARPGHN
jgi:hypothetical protein